MKQYHELLTDILSNGEVRDDRTGVGTVSVFGRQLRFDLTQSFPAVTTKKLAWKSVVSELLWFLEGSGDERRLSEILHGIRDPARTTIWSGNARAPYWQDHAEYEGDLGRVYGVQWRSWRAPAITNQFSDHDHSTVDQIAQLINGLKTNPNSRRHILSAWNVGELDQMALPPCHVMSQYYVSKSNQLSCHMYQRSVDTFLGLPFNIASYALLTHMLAQVCDLMVGELVISTGDTHIYLDHVEQVREQLAREEYAAPTIWLNPNIKDINQFTMDDVKLIGYQSHGTLKANMAV